MGRSAGQSTGRVCMAKFCRGLTSQTGRRGWVSEWVSKWVSVLILHNLWHLLYSQIFQGNTERYFVVVHRFRPTIKARYIRVHPRAWYGHIAMRMELYGCRLGMSRKFTCNEAEVIMLENCQFVTLICKLLLYLLANIGLTELSINSL